MRDLRMTGMLVAGLFVMMGSAQAVPFECHAVAQAPAYTADLSNSGTMHRAVEVSFKAEPRPEVAYQVVEACVKKLVAMNDKIDALGTARIGERQIVLHIPSTRKSQGQYATAAR